MKLLKGKMNKKQAVFAAVIIFVFAVVFFAASFLAGEKTMDFYELMENSGLKEFENEGHTLISLSDDPWVVCNEGVFKDCRSLSVYVDYLSDDYTYSEFFVIDKNQNAKRYVKVLKEGVNYIDLSQRVGGDELRLDLLTGEGQKIGIEKVVINERRHTLGVSLRKCVNSVKDFAAVGSPVLLAVLFALLLHMFLRLKTDKKRVCFVLGCVLGLIVLFALKLFASLAFVSSVYPYKEMSFEELTAFEENINDYEISGGKLISLTNDPWIYYYDSNFENIKTVTVNVNSLSEPEEDGEIFVFYANGTFESSKLTVKEGENSVEIPKKYKDINCLRFDLSNSEGFEMGIDSVEFNRKDAVIACVKEENINLFSKIVLWLAFLAAALGCVCLGRRRFKTDFRFNAAFRHICPLTIFLGFILSFCSALGAVLAAALFAAFAGRFCGCGLETGRKNKAAALAFSLAAAALMYGLIPSISLYKMVFGLSQGEGVRVFLALLCCFALAYTAALMLPSVNREEKEGKVGASACVGFVLEAAVIFGVTLILEVMAKHYFKGYGFSLALSEVLRFKVLYLNILLVGLIYYFIKNLLGDIFGRIISAFVFAVFIIGNYVKLKYHDGVLLPMDFLQIEDFFGIVFRYFPKALFYALVVLIVAGIIFLIYKYRRKIAKHRPNLVCAAVCLCFIVILSNKINANSFVDLGFDLSSMNGWLDAKVCVENEGIVTYSYIKFREITRVFPKADENYSEEYMAGLKEEFDGLYDGAASDVKPDVILVMDESMFDVSKIPDVSFSQSPDENMRKHFKTNIISPKYGGGTGSVEFEGLTGLSNYFFLDNIVPYVTYWNSESQTIPSLASEFDKNGYKTTAVHPNFGGTYNRDLVYKCMGFHEFLNTDNTAFSDEDKSADGYVKDEALADLIVERLESSDEPQFVFTVTIENHTFYDSKFAETEIKVSSDKLSEKEKHQLEQYSQGVLDADRLIEKLVDYVDNAERPTLLYVWGDHLPALSAFSTLGFIEDKYNKYSTPLAAYSNYRDIEIEQEYITPNQIAPQILRDAEIDYSSYFDFIYSLRESYPVVHKSFNVNGEDEQIKKYELVQYDILFGEKYLEEK